MDADTSEVFREKAKKLEELSRATQDSPNELLRLYDACKGTKEGKKLFKDIGKLIRKAEEKKYGEVRKFPARDMALGIEADSVQVLDTMLERMEAFADRCKILKEEILANNPELSKKIKVIQGLAAMENLTQ